MKWGICGTGTIARKFALTLKEMAGEGQRIRAAASRSQEKAELFAAEFDIPRAYGSYEAMAADPEVEAVYIATPNSLHMENCRLYLCAGKAVLCEKPFMLSEAQGREIAKQARSCGALIMEAFWIRFLPVTSRILEVIASGKLGRPFDVQCAYGFVAAQQRRQRKLRRDLGGGARLDIGIYNLGLIQMIFGGEPETISSEVRMSELGTDEWSRITLGYQGGRRAECVTAIGEEMERRAVIRCEKGQIVLPDYQMAREAVISPVSGQEEYLKVPFEINGFEYQIRAFGEAAARGDGECALWNLHQSLALARTMDRIRHSWGMLYEGEGAP